MQQTETSIKDKLYQTIESIDDIKVLEAFYTILSSYTNEAADDTIINELEKREADHIAGKTATYSLEEFKNRTNKRYGY